MPFGKAFVYQAPKRKKSEVFWSGLTGPNAVLAADTNRDLIAWVKTFRRRSSAHWPRSSIR